jgi:hypothetical protein
MTIQDVFPKEKRLKVSIIWATQHAQKPISVPLPNFAFSRYGWMSPRLSEGNPLPNGV